MKYCPKCKIIVALCLVTSLLAGCKNGIPLMSEVKESKGYSLPQTMIFVATEKNRYESVYTDGIWDVVVDKKNMVTFKSYLLGQVKSFLQQQKTMKLMADAEGVTLSAAERERVKQLSKEYFDSLTKGDLDYLDVSLDDVQTVYGDYCLANKLVAEMTKDLDLEISDSEAKVITLQQIEVWNEDTAKLVYEKTQEEGADFEQLAKEYSLNPEIVRELGRGDESKEYEDIAFSLAVGETSGMIHAGQSYYIIKCVSDYNQEATEERKEKLTVQKKEQAFRQIYDAFSKEHPIVFAEEAWEDIPFDTAAETTTDNFFELYKKYFPETGN